MARPLTDPEREAIADAIRNGGTRNQIARDHNRSPSTITQIAKTNGLGFDRTQTKHATAARQVDNASRRAELATGMLEDALRLRQRLFEPVEVMSVSKSGELVSYTLDQPTPSDQRNLAVAVKVLADGAVGVERVDQGGDGRSEIRAFIELMKTGES